MCETDVVKLDVVPSKDEKNKGKSLILLGFSSRRVHTVHKPWLMQTHAFMPVC